MTKATSGSISRGLGLVVAQSRLGIERADEREGLHHGLDRAADGFGNFLVLLVLQLVQVLVDDADGILQRLVFMLVGSPFVVLVAEIRELGGQTLAQIACGHANRIELTHQIDRLAQRVTPEQCARRNRGLVQQLGLFSASLGLGDGGRLGNRLRGRLVGFRRRAPATPPRLSPTRFRLRSRMARC